MPESDKTFFDHALDEARELIDRARLSGSTSLSFAGLAILELPSGLAGLTDLTDLDISGCRELTDLQPLTALTSLQSLDLSYCAQVQDLQPLAALCSLRKASLMGVKIDCSPAAQPLASWIRVSEFYADELIGAPNELGSKDAYSDNALPRIRAWQKDLQAGEALSSTIKIFFLGNGRVGKTQICRRLLAHSTGFPIPATGKRRKRSLRG